MLPGNSLISFLNYRSDENSTLIPTITILLAVFGIFQKINTYLCVTPNVKLRSFSSFTKTKSLWIKKHRNISFPKGWTFKSHFMSNVRWRSPKTLVQRENCSVIQIVSACQLAAPQSDPILQFSRELSPLLLLHTFQMSKRKTVENRRFFILFHFNIDHFTLGLGTPIKQRTLFQGC